MNLLTRLFGMTPQEPTPSPVNAAPAPAPKVPTPKAPPVRLTQDKFGKLVYSSEHAWLTADDEAFLKLPYFSRVDRRGAVVRIVDGQWPSIAVRDEIIAAAGGINALFPAAAMTQYEEILKGQDFTDQLLESLGWKHLTPRYLAQQAEMETAIAAGKQPPKTMSRAELETYFVNARKATHAEILNLSKRAFAIIEPACRNLLAAGRAAVISLDAEEKSRAKRYRAEFLPSHQLKMFIAFAFTGSMAPICGWHASNFLRLPDDPIDLWNGGVEPAPRTTTEVIADRLKTKRSLYRSPDILAAEQELLAKHESAKVAATEAEKKVKSEQLEKLNTLHDRIREGKLNHPADSEPPK